MNDRQPGILEAVPPQARYLAFEAQLARMLGVEDGVTDALFRFTRPVSSATFWCPPLREGRIGLRALGL